MCGLFNHLLAPARRAFACLVLCLAGCGQLHAAWFEAQGQAVIIDGDKQAAKHQATKEALRQAMLFAGASVQSVQTLANGLVQNDQLTLTAQGEVNAVELIDETWHNDYVTVRLRADVFPKPQSCEAASFAKNLATTQFLLAQPRQAQDGQIHGLSAVLPARLQHILDQHTATTSLTAISDYVVDWRRARVQDQAPTLARQTDTQFVLAATVTDVSIQRPDSAGWAFWQSNTATRQFALQLAVYDGMHGGQLLNQRYTLTAPWQFDKFAQVDVHSEAFWRSAYGEAVDAELRRAAHDVAAALACQPATGRVLQVSNQQAQISLGRAQGLQVGDELYLYQTKQVYSGSGDTYLQYSLYPGKVTVTAAYANSATVSPSDDGLLLNIQPNDFVAKR